MASAPTTPWKLLSIITLADYQNLYLPTNSADEANFDYLPFGFRRGRNEGDIIWICSAERLVKTVEVVTLPMDLVTVHPFTTCDGFSGLADVAPGLNGDNKPVFDFRIS